MQPPAEAYFINLIFFFLMNEIIKIETTSEGSVVSARELHQFLESRQEFANWIKNRIEKYDFEESKDYYKLYFDVEGNLLRQAHDKFIKTDNQEVTKAHKIDYVLTLDMAKELSMIENNEKGRQARKYFIECEKQITRVKLPQTYKEALLELVAKIEENEKLQIENTELKPKGEFYDAVAGSETLIDMNQVSKTLNIKGLGRNKLFEFLRSQKILMNDNQPYQQYVDKGYFKLIEVRWTNPKTGDTNITLKTMVFQTGLDFIRKTVKKYYK